MRFTLYVFCSALLTALTISVPARNLLPQETGKLLDRELAEIAIRDSNLPLALRRLAEDYKIPIGIEVSPDDDLLVERHIELKRAHCTLKDVLTALVPADSLYTWEIRDGVINVFPKGRREPLLSTLLETNLQNVRLAARTSRSGFSEELTQTPKIRAVLGSFGVEASNEIYSSHDMRGFGKDVSLTVQTGNLRSVLNQVIRETDAKFWILNRDGKKGEFLLLKL